MTDESKDSDDFNFLPDTEKYLRELKEIKDNRIIELESLIKDLEKEQKKTIEKTSFQIFSMIITKPWQAKIYACLLKKKLSTPKELRKYSKHTNETEFSKYMSNSAVFIDKRGNRFTLNADDQMLFFLKKFIKEFYRL